MGRLPGCSSACWIAGPYRHCRLRGRAVGRARAGTVAGGSPSAPCSSGVYSEGLAPWCRPLLVRCPLGPGRHSGGGSPAARGFADHGDTGLSAACQPVGITADTHLAKWQSARTGPPGGPGQVGRKVKPGAAMGGHGHAHPIQPATVTASSLAAGGLQSDASLIIAIGTGALGAGRTWTRMRAPAIQGSRPGSDHGS
jgi:hypothetical protein